MRVCWEINGSAYPKLMDRAAEFSLELGSTVKLDLRAFDPNLRRALTGAGNQRTLENFTRAASRIEERPDPLLLVPGYVNAQEVGRIARFITDLDPSIPYALLAFGPHFLMPDLPRTSCVTRRRPRQPRARRG